jgi:hypothetical protein
MNPGKLFTCGLDTALVVGRPPALQGGDVIRKVFRTGTNELHRKRLTKKR